MVKDPKKDERGRLLPEDNVVKIRKVTNGYVLNTCEGMIIAPTLDEVKNYLDKKYK